MRIGIKQKNIQQNIRLSLIALLTILLIISLSFTYVLYQQPTTAQQTITSTQYNQNAIFTYQAHLHDNTIYNTNILQPGQGHIFTRLTDTIDISLTYKITADTHFTHTGSYTLIAQLITDIWTKTYELIPTTTFTTNTTPTIFQTSTSINYTHYNDIVTHYNDETGVNANDPTLLIKCNINTHLTFPTNTTIESFSPTLTIPLEQNIIEITGDLYQNKPGIIQQTTTYTRQDVIDQRTIWLITTFLTAFLLALLYIFTQSIPQPTTTHEKQIAKLNKKYGEWIIHTQNPPNTLNKKTIHINSMEDLTKISEDIGKPILHYELNTPKSPQDIYYLIDNDVQYEYILDMHSQTKPKSTLLEKLTK